MENWEGFSIGIRNIIVEIAKDTLERRTNINKIIGKV